MCFSVNFIHAAIWAAAWVFVTVIARIVAVVKFHWSEGISTLLTNAHLTAFIYIYFLWVAAFFFYFFLVVNVRKVFSIYRLFLFFSSSWLYVFSLFCIFFFVRNKIIVFPVDLVPMFHQLISPRKHFWRRLRRVLRTSTPWPVESYTEICLCCFFLGKHWKRKTYSYVFIFVC